jgi:hypothetical protein
MSSSSGNAPTRSNISSSFSQPSFAFENEIALWICLPSASITAAAWLFLAMSIPT